MSTPGSRAAQYAIPEPTEEERNATENQNFKNTPKVRVMTGVEVETNSTVKRRPSTKREREKLEELEGNAVATCTEDERNAAEDKNFNEALKVRVVTGVEVETNPTVKRRPSTKRETKKREELEGNAVVETCTEDDIGITRDAEEESREHEEDEDYDKKTPSTSNTQPQNTGIPDQSLPDTTSLEKNEEAEKAKQTLEAEKSALSETPSPATEPPTGVDNQLSITVQPSTSPNTLFKPNKVSPSTLSVTAGNDRYTFLQRISCGCFRSGGQ